MEPCKVGFHLLILGCLHLAGIPQLHGEFSKCLAVYREGGAPAVLKSPKCPQSKLQKHASHSGSFACQSAMLQGRRGYMEDRTLCMLDVRIPFLGLTGPTEVKVGIMGVFDGHNGAEASEMASKLLLDYFLLHTHFLLDATYSVRLKESNVWNLNKGEEDMLHGVINWGQELNPRASDLERSKFSVTKLFDGSFHLEILKESLLRAMHDIDVTFSKEAARKNIYSGSTAAVILIADGHILVANVGDSKALLCSEKFQSPEEARATQLRIYREQRSNGIIRSAGKYDRSKLRTLKGLSHFFVKELTRDHHPDREDERSRVLSAGGSVLDSTGVPRVNGQLAVSRSIGDIPLKSYGVISAPEVTNWQPLTTNDSYLVAASDGVFEKMSTQGLCDLLWDLHNEGPKRSERSFPFSDSKADCIVNAAFQKGSTDNIAAVVAPLRLTGSSNMLEKIGGMESDTNCLG